ncbi:phosphoserine phosphatase SerB [Rhodovibrio salinarum]|uniref:Phosphoserine phosphatase n=1 Tax=Rhodovibrio salinarum TaxID=1087 RepID=A0A934V2F1_9PROT|nr:phosphoserine phosphatase SerB [Rhodovibrio salinarum]MBK1698744.1 phosphoserine phosphatase SerB [Rhodovibrio salinarum]
MTDQSERADERQVCTLIADPASRDLDLTGIQDVREALRAAGAEVSDHRWLSEHVAADLPYRGITPSAAGTAARKAVADRPLDTAAQPETGRRKAVLIADMDSTIVTGETLDEMSEAVGLKDKIAEITRRAMNGELNFEEALRERVGMLTGLKEADVKATLDRVALSKGAKTAIATLKRHGVTCALVSGGFTAIAEPVAEWCGFDRVVANRLIIEDGALTGEVAEPIVGKEAKLATLREMAGQRGVHESAVASIGDGANDLPMLLAAGLGVAYRAKPSVKAEARFALEHGDLTGLLYLQGYSDDEIAQVA